MTRLTGIAQDIFQSVLEAMQKAEELEGPAGQDYSNLMQAVADEARTRLRNFHQIGLTCFDDYEIHAEADVWRLYGRIPGQGLECIGDFKTQSQAEEVYARITGRAGTAQQFNMDLDGRSGPHVPQRIGTDPGSSGGFDQKASRKRFWDERVTLKDHPASVRVDGSQYVIGAEESTSFFRGYGGQDFHIKFHDGRLVHSTNLWFKGVVPEEYKARLPDNAEFVGTEEFRRLVAEKAAQEREPITRSRPTSEASASVSEPREPREILRETVGARRQRHEALLRGASPIPEDRELPAFVSAPAKSEEGALGRVAGEIASLKEAEFTVWRYEQIHEFGIFVPRVAARGGWGKLTEAGKLDAMCHWVNWEGVGERDRAATLTEHLDLERLSPEVRSALSGEGGFEGFLAPQRVTEWGPVFENPNPILDALSKMKKHRGSDYREESHQKAERMAHIIRYQLPRPRGWELPTLVSTPEASDEQAVRRAAQEIESLKRATFEARSIGPPNPAGDAPERLAAWEELSEDDKLEVMIHWVNWDGVGGQDRVTTAVKHLDLTRLGPTNAAHLRNMGVEESHFEERSPKATRNQFEDRDLLPAEVARTIPRLRATEHEKDPIAHVRLYATDSDWTWFVTEYDPEEKRAYGLVHAPDEQEFGHFSVRELEGKRDPTGAPTVERDLTFDPEPVSMCMRQERTRELTRSRGPKRGR